MFSEWDRRCAAVQIMLSTDPIYDNRTIASNFAGLPQIIGTCPGWWKQSFRLWLWSLVWFQVRGHIMPPHIFEVCLKVNTKVYLDVLKSVVIPWYHGCGSRTWHLPTSPKRPRLGLQKECYDFVPFSHRPPSSPDLNLLDYFVWSYVENITNMTSHNIKASLIIAISRVFIEYSSSSHRHLLKRHAPSSGSVSRQWLRPMAATLNRCHLYLIIKLPELIFSIKVLK